MFQSTQQVMLTFALAVIAKAPKEWLGDYKSGETEFRTWQRKWAFHILQIYAGGPVEMRVKEVQQVMPVLGKMNGGATVTVEYRIHGQTFEMIGSCDTDINMPMHQAIKGAETNSVNRLLESFGLGVPVDYQSKTTPRMDVVPDENVNESVPVETQAEIARLTEKLQAQRLEKENGPGLVSDDSEDGPVPNDDGKSTPQASEDHSSKPYPIKHLIADLEALPAKIGDVWAALAPYIQIPGGDGQKMIVDIMKAQGTNKVTKRSVINFITSLDSDADSVANIPDLVVELYMDTLAIQDQPGDEVSFAEVSDDDGGEDTATQQPPSNPEAKAKLDQLEAKTTHAGYHPETGDAIDHEAKAKARLHALTAIGVTPTNWPNCVKLASEEIANKYPSLGNLVNQVSPADWRILIEDTGWDLPEW